MALDPTILQSEIETQLKKAGFAPDEANNVAKNGFWFAIASAIVTHITDCAEVTVDHGDSAGVYKVQ